MVSVLLPVLCLTVGGRAAHGGEVVLTGEPFRLDAAAAHAAVFVDTGGTLGATDVISPEFAARFTPVTRGVPSVGLTSAAVWLKVDLKSTSERAEAVVADLGTARLSHLEWFVIDEHGTCEHAVACGTSDPPVRGHATSRYPTVFFTVPAGGRRTVLARATSDASIWLPLTVASPREYSAFDGWRDFEDFAHLGWCGSMALLAAGLWLASGRQSLYLTLAAAMGIAALHVAIFNGTYTWLGGPGGPWVLRQGALVLCTLFAFLLTRVTQSFFGWRNLVPAARRMLLVGDAVTIPAIALCTILPNRMGALVALPAMVVTCALSGAASLVQWRWQGGRAPGLLVPAWAILVGSILLLLLQFTGVLPVLLQPMTLLRFMLPATALMFLLAAASSQREFLETKANLAEVREAETQARLDALRQQINPHFLFNTLTSIDELSREAPARIPVVIGRLSSFLRSLLVPDATDAVPLARELESVRDYFDIEKVRFGDRLQVEYDIEAGAERCLVPPLVTMPLVENAVKYGGADDGTLRVRVAARVRDGRLLLRVVNPGSLRRSRLGGGTGIGTANLRDRLRVQFGDDAAFRLAEEQGTVVAEVDLPAREWNR